MKNIFTKGEVLISCSSLRNLDLSKYNSDLHSNTHAIINANLETILINRINNIVEENATNLAIRLSDLLIKRGEKDINRIITEILLARRFRGGTREMRDVELIYKKISDRTKNNLPIRLTFSLYPCKIPNLLKSGGKLADLGDLASMARLKEIALSVKKVYSPGLQIIVLQDGYRFKDILNFPSAIIQDYQRTLKTFQNKLHAEEFIILEDYMNVIHKKIESKKINEIGNAFKISKNKYEIEFGKNIDMNNPLEYLERLSKKSKNSELINKFLSLYFSLIYCVYIPELSASKNNEQLTLSVFSDPFNLNTSSLEINMLRKKIISETWHHAIDYISEITAGRIVKPIEIIFPDSIRCDMHNIKGRLTLYPVKRSTKLASFHSTGYINSKNKINVNFKILLENNNYVPIFGEAFENKYNKQAFGYIDKSLFEKYNNKFDKDFINSILLT